MRVSRKSTLRRRKFHGRIRQQCDFLLIMKTYQTHLIHQPHVLTAAKPTRLDVSLHSDLLYKFDLVSGPIAESKLKALQITLIDPEPCQVKTFVVRFVTYHFRSSRVPIRL